MKESSSCEDHQRDLTRCLLIDCRQEANEFPEYSNPNIWPREVPEMEVCFKQMACLMLEVALPLGDMIDR